MIGKVFWGLNVLLLVGCVTTSNMNRSEYRFPERFKAQQIVTVKYREQLQTLIATLNKRNTENYEVTFLHFFTQTPLLKLTYDGTQTKVERLYDKIPAELPGEGILDSIRSLYDAPGFMQTADGLVYEHGDVRYLLQRLKSFSDKQPSCDFPERIDMTTTQVKTNISLNISTTDVECL